MSEHTPGPSNDWLVTVFTDNATTEAATDVVARVVCYNPMGAVPGAITARVVPTDSTFAAQHGALLAKKAQYRATH